MSKSTQDRQANDIERQRLEWRRKYNVNCGIFYALAIFAASFAALAALLASKNNADWTPIVALAAAILNAALAIVKPHENAQKFNLCHLTMDIALKRYRGKEIDFARLMAIYEDCCEFAANGVQAVSKKLNE